jgi:hypothetical protein
VGAEAPNTKHQTPEKHQTPRSCALASLALG